MSSSVPRRNAAGDIVEEDGDQHGNGKFRDM
jgi:hypothetical protein